MWAEMEIYIVVYGGIQCTHCGQYPVYSALIVVGINLHIKL